MERVPRDNPTLGATFRELTGCGASFFSVKFNFINEVRLIEVFCGSSSKGGCSSNTKMVGRLVSGLLQHGVPIDFIIDQLESEVCSTARYRAGKDEVFRKTGNHSCSKALASALKKALKLSDFIKLHQDDLKQLFVSKDSPEVPDIETDDIESLPISSKISKITLRQGDESISIPLSETTVSDIEEVIKNTTFSPSGQVIDKPKHNQKITPFTEEDPAVREQLINSNTCPDCLNPLTPDGGCVVCRNCGFSKC